MPAYCALDRLRSYWNPVKAYLFGEKVDVEAARENFFSRDVTMALPEESHSSHCDRAWRAWQGLISIFKRPLEWFFCDSSPRSTNHAFAMQRRLERLFDDVVDVFVEHVEYGVNIDGNFASNLEIFYRELEKAKNEQAESNFSEKGFVAAFIRNLSESRRVRLYFTFHDYDFSEFERKVKNNEIQNVPAGKSIECLQLFCEIARTGGYETDGSMLQAGKNDFADVLKIVRGKLRSLIADAHQKEEKGEKVDTEEVREKYRSIVNDNAKDAIRSFSKELKEQMIAPPLDYHEIVKREILKMSVSDQRKLFAYISVDDLVALYRGSPTILKLNDTVLAQGIQDINREITREIQRRHQNFCSVIEKLKSIRLEDKPLSSIINEYQQYLGIATLSQLPAEIVSKFGIKRNLLLFNMKQFEAFVTSLGTKSIDLEAIGDSDLGAIDYVFKSIFPVGVMNQTLDTEIERRLSKIQESYGEALGAYFQDLSRKELNTIDVLGAVLKIHQVENSIVIPRFRELHQDLGSEEMGNLRERCLTNWLVQQERVLGQEAVVEKVKTCQGNLLHKEIMSLCEIIEELDCRRGETAVASHLEFYAGVHQKSGTISAVLMSMELIIKNIIEARGFSIFPNNIQESQPLTYIPPTVQTAFKDKLFLEIGLNDKQLRFDPIVVRPKSITTRTRSRA